MKKQIKILSACCLLVGIFFLSGCGTASDPYKVNLEVWGLYDDSDAFAEIIAKYKEINPHIGEIKYRKFTTQTYKNDLLEAMASGQGPDIFLIHNDWLPSFKNKLESAPAEITNTQELVSNFPDVVGNDFVDGGKIYAYPLSVDSLALFYNKDMFNAAGVSRPPLSWSEFDQAVMKTKSIAEDGSISRAGTAMGTAKNINRATDIFVALMMQNGVEMTDKNKTNVTFDRGVVDEKGNSFLGGVNALGYYTNFAKLTVDGTKPNALYTWNSRAGDSVEMFTQGKVGMMINYSWQIENIKNSNPKLNYGISPLPQIHQNNQASYANYWAYGVAKNKVSPTVSNGQQVAAVPNAVRVFEAWEFLRYLTVNNKGIVKLTNAVSKNSMDFSLGNFDPAAKYLEKTNKPAARRDLIEKQKNDPLLSAFAAENLIAKTWYQVDPDRNEAVLTEAIDSVNRGAANPGEALNLAATRIKAIMQEKPVGN